MSDQVDMVTAQETAGTAGGDENAPVEPVTPAAAADAAPAAVPDTAKPKETSATEEGTTPEATAETADAAPADAASDATPPETPTAEEQAAPEEAEAATPAAEATSDSEDASVEDESAKEPAAEDKSAPEAAEAAAPAAEEQAAPEASAEDESDKEQTAEEKAEPAKSKSRANAGKRKVRVLSVGQEVHGTVKRIADFGAFVDIGVGRDGLIHISELSVRRVGKVTDVLSEGQEVTAWIKKLDRERNRISLTLIDPETKTIRDLEKDEVVQGTVTRILPYGAFVDIGIGRDALLHVREMAEGFVAKPEDVVQVGESIEARIIELSRRRGRVDLSLKGLRPEPEAAVAYASEPEQGASSAAPESDEDTVDIFEDTEVLSPMELAFKRAMEAEGIELRVSNKKKQGKRNRRDRNRSIQDEIISRTLDSGNKK